MRPNCRWLQNLARLVALVGLVLAVSYRTSGQTSATPSLGEVARRQRDKQQDGKKPPVKAKKVVTDEDIPAHNAADDENPSLDGPHSEMSVPRSTTDVLRTGDQMKASIAQQKAAVADLKARVDKLNASIHFVSANAYRNGVEYNKAQAHKQQEVERLQSELDEQKKSLEQMQETARRAGYGSAVWDP
jgi:predicted RNase H-like nuclease (RuvC/YqgF family)